jgi:polyisoprenyl-teichoic acid--peptidoglycan teichoic acid transferase
MMEETKPTRSARLLDEFQPMTIQPSVKHKKGFSRARKLFWLVFLLIVLYFLAPFRTNILLLGTDDSPERGALGRTDTIILTTIVPLKPYIGMLSIPRDLWVTVPNIGEQRINTAYFFAEADKAGTGGSAAMQTIHENFGVTVRNYAVVHMYGVVEAVNALGGVEINLEAPIGGYPAGSHNLTGIEALTFVRDRASSSDFSRMQRTQILLLAMLNKAFEPSSWRLLPQFVFSITKVVDTNIPAWQWPRLLFVFLRAPIFGIDSRTITPNMVVPFVTSGGAQVLGPNWDAINPLMKELFGQ